MLPGQSHLCCQAHRRTSMRTPGGVVVPLRDQERGQHGRDLLRSLFEAVVPAAGYRLGSERGSPNQGSTLLSKRVMAQIRPPVRVSTYRPVPCRMPLGARR